MFWNGYTNNVSSSFASRDIQATGNNSKIYFDFLYVTNTLLQPCAIFELKEETLCLKGIPEHSETWI